MTIAASPIITETEYLKLEEISPVRHEFINGKMFEMSGGTFFHEKVVINFLKILFRCTNLQVYSQGFRVRLPETKNYYYPDVVIAENDDEKTLYTSKPLVIIEVLSPSTRLNDLTDKFIAYRQFATLQYYLVAEADFCRVTLFYRDEQEVWEMEEYNQQSDTISLSRLSISLPLTDIYSGLPWAESE